MPGLDNPYISKTNPLNQPLPTPNVVSVGNIDIITKKPIVKANPTNKSNPSQTIPYKIIRRNEPTKLVFETSKEETKPENVSWWQKKSKTQKIMLIGGSVLGLAIIGVVIYTFKNRKK